MAVRFEAGATAPTVGRLQRTPAFTGTPYTVVAWFAFDDDSVSSTEAFDFYRTDFSVDDFLELRQSNVLRVGTDNIVDSASGAWQDATWHCMAMVRSSTTQAAYVLDRGVAISRSTTTSAAFQVEALLGYLDDGNATGRAVTHYKCWTAALTHDELAREMQQFAPIRTADLVAYAKLEAHTDLSDEIAGSFSAVNVTPSTVPGPTGVPGEWEGPRVASSATTVGTTSAGGLSCNLPSGIEAGDLLLAHAANDTSVSWSASAGWELIDDGANGSAVQGATWARIATGSDALTITGEAQDIAVVVERIVNHGVTDVTTDIIKGTAATGSSNAPNGPNCNPGTSGKYLWITYYAADDDDDTALWWPVEGAPVAQIKSATGTSSCMTGVAYRWLEASSYGPSAFALSASEEWRAQTFAIPPATPVTAPTGLDAEGTSASEIEVSWDTDVGDDSYDVRFRSTHTLPSVTTQSSSVPWHLERIYQRTASSTGNYQYRYTGAGVRIYVMDTGVRATHDQLSGRVVNGFDPFGGSALEDGHGTACAGCAAASLVGAAKGATIVSVRIRESTDDPHNTQEYLDNYLGALAWIVSDAASSNARGVLTSSLSPPTERNPTENAQVAAAWQAVHDAGVVCVYAVDNNGVVLPDRPPENVADVIKVAASNSSDQYASDSDHGSGITIVAPGHEIPIIWYTSDSATTTSSGTSLATPIVAGVCAMLLEENPTASPARIRELLIQQATPGVLTSMPANTVNLLLYSGATSTEWTTRTGVAEPYTIDDLEPEQEYEIAVRRTVDSQTSEWSTGVLTETPVEIDPSGIASSATYGSATISNVSAQTISSSSLSSNAAFGSVTVAKVTAKSITLVGLTSNIVFGSSTLLNATPKDISFSGLVSNVSFGTALVAKATPKNITASGIVSATVVGDAVIGKASPKNISPNGIASSIDFGLTDLAGISIQTITVSSISSVATVGTQTVSKNTAKNVAVDGIVSSAVVGTHTITKINAQNISPDGITTNIQFGATFVDDGSGDIPDSNLRPLYRIAVSLGFDRR